MIKKLSVLAMAGLIALPAVASAASNAELEAQIEELSEQLSNIEEKAEGWDQASRFQISGDIRNRMDHHSLTTAAHYTATGVAAGAADFMMLGTDFSAAYVGGGGSTTDLLGVAMGAMGFGGFTWLDANRAVEEANLVGAGFTARESTALWSMMNNPTTGAMLNAMAADGVTTVADFVAMVGNFEAVTSFMSQLPADVRKAIFTSMSESTVNNITNAAYAVQASQKYVNESSYTTRLRMNMRVKATENVEIKVRTVAYKFWGNQSSQNGETDEYTGEHVTDANPYFLNSRSFDGTVGRQPGDSAIVLDRAFMNWNNIGGAPVWFSIGRRPTTDGPPAHLRLGSDKRMATPINFMDYPFDGISMGYAYSDLFGMSDAPGRFRLCYGRGFESGSSIENTGMHDVDFGGFDWDVYKKGSRFINLQAFGAFNIFNVPGDTEFPNPYELAGIDLGWSAAQFATYAPTMNGNGTLDRQNMGNIYHTSAIYMDEVANLNYFATLGWSRTDPNGTDEMGISLLGDSFITPEAHSGYGVYVGGRYDMDDLGLKVGAEYNWGSEYWLAFTPGHDDMYGSKLQTRGQVFELYMIYDLPSGEPVSKFGKAFIRLGYQHYKYKYSYSGMWLGTPNEIDSLANDPMAAQFYAPVDKMDQVYLSIEGNF